MVSMPSEANWPVTFPGNLRWSNATQIVKGMVAYGAAAMAEVDLIVQRLKARAGEADLDRVWMEEWSKEADRVAKIARGEVGIHVLPRMMVRGRYSAALRLARKGGPVSVPCCCRASRSSSRREIRSI